MRLKEHPILDIPERKSIGFTFDGRSMEALEGEVISSALFSNGVRVFGRHVVDNSPQGIFCANGQCAQCLVLADGVPVKACITEIKEGMKVDPIQGLPELPEDDSIAPVSQAPEMEIDVLIVGGGPAGLSAAIELGRMDVHVMIVDDKLELGGKLSLQTHNFFGSIKDCYAGSRGMNIGKDLAQELEGYGTVEVWLNSPVVGVFSDKKVGVVRDGVYTLLAPHHILIATGAREKSLAFPGGDLPGVYGAGAFQTLVNRDLVQASERIFILGGGNVGLITAYHAIQAGMEVAGIAEALPSCGGYKVHLDKLRRLGVPIYTSHTVVCVEGEEKVEKVIISEIDRGFQPIEGTEKEFDVDTLLIAVGLNSVDELTAKAQEFGLSTYSAGDAAIIAEASAAMFSGKIVGRKILSDMGYDTDIPSEWDDMLELLRSDPGPTHPMDAPSYMTTSGSKTPRNGIYPIIRCTQEIPCDPCTAVCPKDSIHIPGGNMKDLPIFDGECVGCGKCVCICPGLAITLVDRNYDSTGRTARVVVPWELPEGTIRVGMNVVTAGFEGERIGQAEIIDIRYAKWQDRRRLVSLAVPWDQADLIAGIRIIDEEERKAEPRSHQDDDVIVCRCERVTKGAIREEIRNGARDMNALKAILRVGMGPCGGKTCIPLIEHMFKEEGVNKEEMKEHVERPFTQEVPIYAFIRGKEGRGG